jgi:hypothetical protein
MRYRTPKAGRGHSLPIFKQSPLQLDSCTKWLTLPMTNIPAAAVMVCGPNAVEHPILLAAPTPERLATTFYMMQIIFLRRRRM